MKLSVINQLLTKLQKIECGYKHFEALGNAVVYKATDDFNKFAENI